MPVQILFIRHSIRIIVRMLGVDVVTAIARGRATLHALAAPFADKAFNRTMLSQVATDGAHDTVMIFIRDVSAIT
jgi:hypothetical protein